MECVAGEKSFSPFPSLFAAAAKAAANRLCHFEKGEHEVCIRVSCLSRIKCIVQFRASRDIEQIQNSPPRALAHKKAHTDEWARQLLNQSSGSNLAFSFSLYLATRVQRLLNNFLRLATHKHALICGYESQRALGGGSCVQPTLFQQVKEKCSRWITLKLGHAAQRV